MTNLPGERPTPEEIRRGVAEMLARSQPEVWRSLLAKHVPDARGRCRACRQSSRGAPLSPCNLWLVADHARRLAERG
ncbi:MAG TPA: hypothetical protein VGH89_10230 [Pseudonocardia sp.]|jgi:hypothetical protein